MPLLPNTKTVRLHTPAKAIWKVGHSAARPSVVALSRRPFRSGAMTRPFNGGCYVGGFDHVRRVEYLR